MGMEDEHMVFEAELLGVAMDAKLIKTERVGKHMIGLDNQAALQTM